MTTEATPVHVFSSHFEAEKAIHTLQRSGFDITKLSIIGRGYETEEHPIGFYTAKDKIRAYGTYGAFWGGIWGMLVGPAIFLIPGIGLLPMVGPIVSVIVGALEGAIIVGGMSALGVGLLNMGIPRDQIIKYEMALRFDKYLLIVHGDTNEIARANSVLNAVELQSRL